MLPSTETFASVSLLQIILWPFETNEKLFKNVFFPVAALSIFQYFLIKIRSSEISANDFAEKLWKYNFMNVSF